MLALILILILILSSSITATSDPAPASQDAITTVAFRPSVAIVMGIFAVMFSLTFLLLMYAKFCHPITTGIFGPGLPDSALGPPPRSRSGMDKSVVEALPFFRFASLKGSRDGLECAVCLSRFEDAELLRLLPRCKHAFHIECVDRWLEAHSSCPLCRQKVDPGDVDVLKGSASIRSLLRIPEESNDLELFIEREPSFRHGSSRFTIGSSFRKSLEENESALLAPEADSARVSGELTLHKLKHKIIVSDVFFNNRWSDVNSSDIISLNSDMLHAVSSKRFESDETVVSDSRPPSERVQKIKEEMDRRRALDEQMNRSHSVAVLDHLSSSAVEENYPNGRPMILSGDRCMSEITNGSRFRVSRDVRNDGGKDDKVRRVWLPIARRTVQWFAGREKRSQLQYARDDANV